MDDRHRHERSTNATDEVDPHAEPRAHDDPSEEPAVLRVPARDLPTPRHLSPRAQLVLGIRRSGETTYPALDDHDAWRDARQAGNALRLAAYEPMAAAVEAAVAEIEIGPVPVYVVTPVDVPLHDNRVFLDVHGGALTVGNGAVCRATGILATRYTGVTTWAVDYRLPPEHPYPTPLDDCLAVYEALLERHAPGEIMLGGMSAGANLVAATILKARDTGLPLPAAAVLLSPELDLTESGDSFRTNMGIDNVLAGSPMQASLLYANGHDLTDPYLSPLFGDFTKGFPPTILTAGTRDLFLSNAVRMHRALRAADIEADLHIMEAAPHAGFLGAPEDEEITREVRRFVDTHWQ